MKYNNEKSAILGQLCELYGILCSGESLRDTLHVVENNCPRSFFKMLFLLPSTKDAHKCRTKND